MEKFQNASEYFAPRSAKKTAWPIDQAVPTDKVSIFYALSMCVNFHLRLTTPKNSFTTCVYEGQTQLNQPRVELTWWCYHR